MIGIILAGGAATRLGGGDKGLLRVGGAPILERVIAMMRGQCDHLVLSANDDPARFAHLGLPVVPDDRADRAGPLAGVLAGLDWVAIHHPGARGAVTVPTDTPFLPGDLVSRLLAARGSDEEIACARSNGRVHPVAAVWPVVLRQELRAALVDDGIRKVGLFLARRPVVHVDWPVDPFDPFFNINNAEDVVAANRIARRIDRPEVG